MTNDTPLNLHICLARIYLTSVSVCIVNYTALTSVKWKRQLDYYDNMTKYTVYKPNLKLFKIIYMLFLYVFFLKNLVLLF